MKRLMRYFILSMICNVAMLAFLFLPQNSTKTNPANDGKPVKGFSLMPATILPGINEKNINESLNNRKYRPEETDKHSTKAIEDKKVEKIEDDRHVKIKDKIDIPDFNKKKKQFLSADEYKKYKSALPLQGTIVTEMHVNFPENITDGTIREIISFFGFKIVAYPDQDPDYLLVCNAPEFRFEKLNTNDQLQKFYHNNSNRTIEPESDLLYWARSELSKQGINSDSLRISIVLGNSAGYFHWKETLAANNSSKPIADVSYTEAKISKVPQGYWLLLVEGLYLKNGQYLKIKDQELNEILL